MSFHTATVPIWIQVLFALVWGFGIVANTFLITILLRYVQPWNTNKTMLLAFHASALVFLCFAFFPLVATMTEHHSLSSEQCTPIVPFLQWAVFFQPLSLVLNAVLRWRIIKAAVTGKVVSDASVNGRIHAVVLALAMALFVLIVTIRANSVGSKAVWSATLLTCFRLTKLWSNTFTGGLIAMPPIMVYCYTRIITVLNKMVRGTQTEARGAVRLFVSQTVLYYMTYLPFSIIVIFRNTANPKNLPSRILTWTRLLYSGYPALSPVVSILLTPRFREVARAVLTGQPVPTQNSSRKESWQTKSNRFSVKKLNKVQSVSLNSGGRMQSVSLNSEGKSNKAAPTKDRQRPTVKVVSGDK